MKRAIRTAAIVAAGFLAAVPIALAPQAARAASHSDAPLIKLDPQANLTDVYAFVGAGPNGNVLNVIVHVRPFSEPGDGGQYEKFSDDALYSIHIANPSTGATLRRYDFQFSSVKAVAFGNTILNYGRGGDGSALGAIMDNNAPSRNFKQTFTLTRVNVASGAASTSTTGLLTPPPNVGLRTTPNYNDSRATINGEPNPGFGFAVSGATTAAGLDNYTRDAIYTIPTGETTFCGPREDGFFSDIPGIFDFLSPRILLPAGSVPNPNPLNIGGTFGQQGGGVDGFKGFNVLAYSIQIPLADLQGLTSQYTGLFAVNAQGAVAFPTPTTTTGVGVYASVSRRRVTLRSATADPVGSGPFIQVNRMGNPLFNEAFVAMQDKDNFNRDSPTTDNARYATYALNPELGVLINALYGPRGANVLPEGDIDVTNRNDLAAVFMPDVLRVDTTTSPVRLAGTSGFSRLGGYGADLASNGNLSGWPNGRRFGDDVIDIALSTLVSGGTLGDGEAFDQLFLVGDNADANDQLYQGVFPYSATPHAGTRNRKDSDPATAGN
ncbi:MAG: DUF4331 domain-containing protein [Akkermansiaceae bacterium]|nr:DUF4331 domain-containing protein [Armatimonadota bacterium]